MRIEQAELRIVRMPLKHPFATALGTTAERTVLLLTLRGEGVEGYGECVAEEAPLYREETVATARAVIDQAILPRVIGHRFPNPASLAAALAPLRGNPMAKATVEMAFWDLWARSLGLPLWQLLGGVHRRVPAGVSLGLQPTLEATLEAVRRHLAQGYRRIKLKIRPGWDVQIVAAVRDRFPSVALSVDANCAYSLADAHRLAELDRFGLEYIEQPLAYDDLQDHAVLQATLRTPLCLDESITTARDARKALAAGACRVINLKPGRVGGLLEARKVHDVAEAFGAPVWCGGMLETGIGRAHNIHLATLPNFTLPGDISSASRYWETDVINEPLEIQDGWMPVPEGPGIGVTPRSEYLDRVTLERRAWSAGS